MPSPVLMKQLFTVSNKDKDSNQSDDGRSTQGGKRLVPLPLSASAAQQPLARLCFRTASLGGIQEQQAEIQI